MATSQEEMRRRRLNRFGGGDDGGGGSSGGGWAEGGDGGRGGSPVTQQPTAGMRGPVRPLCASTFYFPPPHSQIALEGMYCCKAARDFLSGVCVALTRWWRFLASLLHLLLLVLFHFSLKKESPCHSHHPLVSLVTVDGWTTVARYSAQFSATH